MEKNSYAIDSTTTVIASQQCIAREDHNTQNDEIVTTIEQIFGPVIIENEKKIENVQQEYKEKCDVLIEYKEAISDSNDSYAIVTNDDPKNWPTTKKWWILFIVIVSGMLSPVTSTILYPALIILQQELQTSETVVNSLVSIFIYCMGIAPIVWAAYSDEFATRRKVYLASMMVFNISTIICAISKNIWLLLIMRAVQACGSSAVLSIGSAIISDIYVSTERGHAYGLFYLAYWLGPFIGPMCGGYLTEYFGWRWMFWFLAIYGGIIFIMILLFLPETSRTVSSPTSPTGASTTPRFNPISPLKLLRYPNVTLVVIYVSIISSTIHLQYVSVPRNFSQRYNLSSSTIGLLFIAPAAGCAFGSLFGGKYSDFVLRKKTENSDSSYPEMRIHSAWSGALLVPCSYLAYGWLLENNYNLIVLMILWFLGSLGTLIVFNSLSSYLVDAYITRSASATALNNCFRFMVAGTVAILEPLMEDALGTGWMFTFIVSLGVVSALFVVLVYLKGKEWRENCDLKNTESSDHIV
ncbi:MFS general substrate transporter [Gigaspora margarita]|uniref:MFS general substrate transporter n=1 Tax=Gigaspora margarita TaxID=4874 RepID=A0A8H3XLG8_GIGMA|nr:MFS general substrate transporter [Gigaspora margarita]